MPEEGSRFLNVARQRKTLSYSQCVSQPQTAATESPVGGGTEAPAGVGTRRSPGVLLVSPAGVLVPPVGVRTRTPPGPDSSRPDVKVVDRRDEKTAAAASSGGERSSRDTEEAL